MKRSPRPRTTAKLSKSVHQQLNKYALAAGAAGVGMLALARPAEARIVYTKTDVDIFSPTGFPLDLTNDRTTDFVFWGYAFSTTGFGTSGIFVCVPPGNGFWQGAAALRAGVRIGPPFQQQGLHLMRRVLYETSGHRRYFYGPWENNGKGVQNRYLGLKFKIKGKTHYGWARLNFPSPTGAKLLGYAYETIPNKAIITGKTKGTDVVTMPAEADAGTLGHLAQGRK